MTGIVMDSFREQWYTIFGVSMSFVALWLFLSQGEKNIKTVWRNFSEEIKEDPAVLCLVVCFFTGFAILWLPVLIVALIYRVATMDWAKRLMRRVADLARSVSACLVGFG